MATTSKGEAAKAAGDLKRVADSAAKAGKSPPVGHFAMNPKLTPELGRLVSILMASPVHRRMSLADAAMMLLPPIATNQFFVAEAKKKDSDARGAVGFLLWARVSDAVDKRMRTSPKAARPQANEWASGDKVWVVDSVGPPAVVGALLKQALASQFKGREVTFWRRGADGKPALETLKG
jgi:hemolysin-activating ACP:hemolysin acyltransferase